MRPIKVTFLNQPKVEPKTTYKRCILTLWLLKCSYPNYALDTDMNVIIEFDNGKKYNTIIKAGFECDLASIPRLAWSIYPPDGNYRYIAILHDILYRTETFTRLINDMVFKIGMSDKVPDDVRNLFYKSVRLGGSLAYKQHTVASIKEAKKYIHISEIK